MRVVPRLMQEAFMVAVICCTYVVLRLTIATYTRMEPASSETSNALTSSCTAVYMEASSSTTSKAWIGWRDFLAAIFAKPKAINTNKRGRSFTVDYKHSRFLKDGEPFRIIAGTMHYFRVPRGSWKDRLQKMKMAGLNAVHTLVEWSGHEPEKGIYDFEGNYNLTAFLSTAQEVGLCVLLCLGPYIGSERDNGGLPYWLLHREATVRYRCSHFTFTTAVEDWLDILLPQLSSFWYHKGGSIVAVEVEHKYGSHHACDRNYMEFLLKIIKMHLGDQVAMFTTDVWKHVKCGSVKGALATIAVRPGVEIKSNVTTVPGPLLATLEIGVASRWGSPRSGVDASLVQSTFERLLELNASVVLNVFHGGTNFGFRSGADLAPYTTSYDYGAPLSEAGDATPLYYGIRKTIDKFVKLPPLKALNFEHPLRLGRVWLSCGPSPKLLMDHFRKKGALKAAAGKRPLSFEKLGQDFGLVTYKTKINFWPSSPSTLRGLRVRDRGYIYTKRSVYAVDSRVSQLQVVISKGEYLVIVVENTGRNSSGSERYATKGLLSQVSLDGFPLTNWTTEAVPLTRKKDIAEITRLLRTTRRDTSCKVPSFFYGRFTLPVGTAPRSTYLDLTGWTKGIAYVNGFNLGRYWPAVGPQITLFVPGSFLLPSPKENLILLFEIEGTDSNKPYVELVNAPKLDGPTPGTGM